MELTGKLHVKGDTQEISASFKKREFVLLVADNPQYPQFVSFQLTQEKCALLDVFSPNMDITVSFNIRGRAWYDPKEGKNKYFNTLEAWRIVLAAPTQSTHVAPAPPPITTPQPIAQPTTMTPPTQVDVAQMDDSDDMPF